LARETARCLPWGDLGDRCFDDDAPPCPGDQVCSSDTGRCERLPFLSDGDSCRGTQNTCLPDDPLALETLACDYSTLRCRLPLAEGAACRPNSLLYCAVGTCLPATKTCGCP
jgi:hypothetical protein